MAEAQEPGSEDDPDLIEDNAGENEPPAGPLPPKEKKKSVHPAGRRSGGWQRTDMAYVLIMSFV